MPAKNKAAYNEYMRKYMLRKYQERRAFAVQKLGGACVKCGETEGLELDHIDPKNKTFPISRVWSCSEKLFLAEIVKCQLLCQRHHIEKTRADRGQANARETHGTLSSYRYCKCALCRAAKRDYTRLYRQRVGR